VDLLIRGPLVVQGEGQPRRADVAVEGGHIAAVEPSLDLPAAAVVEGAELLLCPGFIDMHAHSALQPFADPRQAAKVGQGFTTEVILPDGLSPAPVTDEGKAARRAYLLPLEGPGPAEWTWAGLGRFLDSLAATRPATTLVPSVGHNAVRDVVLGSGQRQPDAAQLSAMRREVREGFEQGARMLSFGLIYVPGVYASTDELVELSREASRVGAPLVPHIRNEGAGVLSALAEMIDVARRAQAPLHVSHLKVIGNPELVEPLLQMMAEARREIDLTCDQYPYGAGSTILAALLPPWAQEGGAPGILERLRHPADRAAIRRDVEAGLPGWENVYRACGPERIYIAQAGGGRKEDEGKTLSALASERGQEPLDAVFDLLLEAELAASMIDHYASEETVRTIFRESGALVGSDGIFGPRPHPRLFGSAARVLGRYSLREGLIPLTEAVARLTWRAADRLRLGDRGRIAAGKRADLVLLDPRTYVDTATYEDPARSPDGVRLVLVAGVPVWSPEGHTGSLPGGVLREAMAGA
jgi:N-acyl-D-amino-acid deacylase